MLAVYYKASQRSAYTELYAAATLELAMEEDKVPATEANELGESLLGS